jgi:hypothetical protein
MLRPEHCRRSDRLTSFAIAIALFGASALRAGETALDRYVAKPDPTYSWKVVRNLPGKGLTQFIVDLKSQTWRTEQDVDRPVWQHWLTIVKPANPAAKLAFLRIVGGANGGEPPQSAEPATLKLAESHLPNNSDDPFTPHHPRRGRRSRHSGQFTCTLSKLPRSTSSRRDSAFSNSWLEGALDGTESCF